MFWKQEILQVFSICEHTFNKVLTYSLGIVSILVDLHGLQRFIFEEKILANWITANWRQLFRWFTKMKRCGEGLGVFLSSSASNIEQFQELLINGEIHSLKPS